MADEKKSFADEESQSQSSFPYKADFDMAKSNTVDVGGSDNMNVRSSANFQGTTMNVPERIVLDGSFESKESNELEQDWKGNGVNFQTYNMGGMMTPPRTLTVDDTSFSEKTNREAKETLKNAEEMYAAASDENRMIQESSNQDLLVEISHLDKRVSNLEMQLEAKQSNSTWKTALVCLLTVLNPILIHWWFNKRRF